MNVSSVFKRARIFKFLASILSLVLISVLSQEIAAGTETYGSGNCVQTVGASAGVTVVESGSDCIVTFNVSSQATAVTNSWEAPTGVTSVRVLVVGGGASGDRGWCGYYYGHGGGGGQVRDLTTPISAGTTYSIQVGGGGSVNYTSGCPNTDGDNGDDTYFNDITAYGGKGAKFNAADGGDSGGTHYKGESGPITGLGGGAGAGAGGPGGTTLLKGGAGLDSNISGTTLMYGSGGAGQNSSGAGTAFSGGASATTSATDNRGGGGMDPGGISGRQNGAAGVVIIRYAWVTTCTPVESRNDSSTVLTFTNVGTCNWQAPKSISSISVLLVGGGGGGGGWVAGGGGGGGVVQQQTSISSGTSYPISVAAGGRGTHVMGGTAISAGSNGGDTTAFGLTAFGGGFGATWLNHATGSRATGGGGARITGIGSAATPDPSISPAQGFAGGSGSESGATGYPSGGGGGAGSAGGNAVSGTSGSGGAGIASSISGSSIRYGGGGGGGCHDSACTSGLGVDGGGNGAGYSSSQSANGSTVLGSSGIANRGGGGGGAGVPYSQAYKHAIGGSGGSGLIVISFVRYTSSEDFSLEFNGTNQYAYASDTSTFDVPGDLTIQVWVNPASANANSIIVRKELSYQIYQQEGYWYFSVSPSGTSWSEINTNVPVRANEWHHLAITRAANSNSAIFYYDGKAAKTGSGLGTSANRDSSDPFILGGWFSSGVYQSNWKYAGKLDHLQVYAAVRTETQIASDMHSYVSPTTSNLRVSYDFNEGTGARLFNRTSAGTLATDLTLVNSPSWSDIKTVDTTSSAAHTIVKFPRSYITTLGGWITPAGVTKASLLVVAGGGAGGSRVGGGGGAGGLVLRAAQTLTPGRAETVTVGSGGFGVADYAGKNGTNSAFSSTTIAIGGGGGGASNNNGERSGRAGGSGGGTGDASGNGTSNQTTSPGSSDGRGFAGGVGEGGGSWSAGGGGGSAGAGYSGTASGKLGFGGDGTLLDISGSSVCYAAGGGGGVYGNSATRSLRGNGGRCSTGSISGGSGSISSFIGDSATANTGSGGGGAGYGGSSDAAGGNGASGIVIIRWINATTPIFTSPAYVDTTTAGRNYTFRFSGSATTPLVRYYNWQFSSDTGETWSTIQSSTSDSYTATSVDYGTSGSRFLYRAIVTDSDTVGLTISDTSTTFYLVVNMHPTISPPSQNTSGMLVHLDASNSSSFPGSGTSWNDLSGGGRNANLGITSGGPAALGYASGVTCSAPAFSTSNGGIFNFSGNSISPPKNCAWIPNSRYSDVGETYTVQMWVKPTSNSHSSWSSIISTPWVSGNKINFAIIYDGTSTGSNQNLMGGYFDGSSWITTSSSLPIITNAWNHLALVSRNRSLTLYVNGVSTSSVALTSAPSGASKGVLIGQRWDNASNFSGSIGVVKISSAGMTADEVKQDYYQSSGRFITTATANKPSTKTYATSYSETFTANNGTGNKNFTFSPNNRAGISWDTTTANTAVLNLTSALSAGTYYETLTATDSVTASTTLALTITVNKAQQATVTIGQYNAFVGTSSYPLNVYGGSTSGTITRTLTDSGTAQCVMTGGMFLTATKVGKCSVQAVKAGDSNYFSETATATIFWIQWSETYATKVSSVPTEIVLQHKTEIIRHSYETLTVTSYTDTATVPNTITSARPGQTIRILGTGFVSTDTSSQATFTDNEYADRTDLTNDYIQVVVPDGAVTGPITVDTLKGTAIGPTLTIASP